MNTLTSTTVALALAILAGTQAPPAAATPTGVPTATAAAARTLQPYAGEAEFVDALTRWRDEAARAQRQALRRSGANAAQADAAAGTMAEATALPAPPATPAAKSMAAPAPALDRAAPGARDDESITNVQTAGVDEGGIVKRAGDHLVILRRGRLFTVRVGGDSLQPVAMLDAYAPGSNPQGAWYDEMLVSGRDVIVIGYSYARGGTEVGLFELGADGSLAYRATWHLRSFDYYSSRNYASRLVGRKLVFYTPTVLSPWGAKPWDTMPAWRRWHAQATPGDFKRLLPATRIYRTDDDFDPAQPLALHTVTTCDLGAPDLGCESTAVLGPTGRVFYVSTNSVYVWTTGRTRGPWSSASPVQSAVFRLPLDGGAPSGIKTAGVPIDQLSFLEEGDHLNVLLRDSGAGEGMWGAEHGARRGALALLRLPLAALGDGRDAAQRRHYRLLPTSDAQHNRYVGDWLLWGGHGAQEAHAVRYADRDAAAQRLKPGHAVERIEAMGRDAVLVGNAGADLHFTSVRLQGDTARLGGRHVREDARQGEQRTHGFFYRPTGDDDGLLGLPVIEQGTRAPRHGVYRGRHGSAAVTFLRQRDGDFRALGELRAEEGQPPVQDACKASCVDWYGNARPIFLGQRIFALLGYELVEGRLEGGRFTRERIEERRRISFAPGGEPGERYSPFQ